MVTALIVGASIAGAALAGKAALGAYARLSAGGGFAGLRAGSKYYMGGFESRMSRREAGLILGVKENAPRDKVKEAHRRIMLANHPDRGGSPYVASKINEAKQMMENAAGSGGSVFRR